MDHNLGDSLTLEGDMETVTMDFEHSEDVVSQDDIVIEESRLEGISMAMDDVEEHSTVIETSGNEVIVSDFIEDAFPFQEYTIQDDGSSGSNITINPNQLSVQNEPIIIQNTEFSEQSMLKLTTTPSVSNMVTLKVAPPKLVKRAIAPPPREVAIAPKPAVQYNIAPKPVATKPIGLKQVGPKPVALISNAGPTGSGKQSKTNEDSKGGTVITQIGRKLVMMPKKIKLMSSTATEGSSGVQYTIQRPSDQGQIIGTAKKGKPLLKFIQIQGKSSGSVEQSSSNAGVARTPAAARYVMQQKTVPISIAGTKVVQNVKVGTNKKQIIAIKSQSPKAVSSSQGSVGTNKVLITANSNPKVLIRTSAPTSTTQVFKDAGQRTQLHPINVPGKGIQYIKLVTNHPTQKTGMKQVTVPSKNFVFTDKQGNVIQMRTEKIAGAQQPPPLVFAGIAPGGSKGTLKTQPVTLKTQRKLVKIAPVTKTATQSTAQPVRSSQSLLAPMTKMATTSVASITPIASTSSDMTEGVSLEEFNEMVEQKNLSNIEEYTVVESQLEETGAEVESHETVDVKPTLQSLISDAVSEESASDDQPIDQPIDQPMDQLVDQHFDVEIELDKKSLRNASFILRDDNVDQNTTNTSDTKEDFTISTSQANDSSYSNDSQADYSVNASFVLREDGTIERDVSNISGSTKKSVLLVPAAPLHNDNMYSDESQPSRHALEGRKSRFISIEAECDPFSMSPNSPPTHSEDVELGMRPRKPCNCTKSQCLKLYCDCFANGEFCNKCNCNNCQNNLENEDIRQKAIRSCLERNPNAFRPKIGKSKTAAGPEIVRRHTKGCNCKRSGCLKKYCECYEAKIACTSMCKCVGCRNIEATLVRRRDALRLREKLNDSNYRPATAPGPARQPCSFMTSEVIEAVCQCLIAAASGGDDSLLRDGDAPEPDPVQDVIEEFARCLQDVISASHHQL